MYLDNGSETEAAWNVTILRILKYPSGTPVTDEMYAQAVDAIKEQPLLRGCFLLARAIELINSGSVHFDGRLEGIIDTCTKRYGSVSLKWNSNIREDADLPSFFVKTYYQLSQQPQQVNSAIAILADWVSQYRTEKFPDFPPKQSSGWSFCNVCDLLAHACKRFAIGQIGFFDTAFTVASLPSHAEQEILLIHILNKMSIESQVHAAERTISKAVPPRVDESDASTFSLANLVKECKKLSKLLVECSGSKGETGFNYQEYVELFDALRELHSRVRGFGFEEIESAKSRKKRDVHQHLVDVLNQSDLAEQALKRESVNGDISLTTDNRISPKGRRLRVAK
ncbi:hypothetical protein SH501x_003205 [Pirellulaceae bacterium SH501]